MKKIIEIFKGYMIRPIIYKSITRCSIAIVIMLLWERFVESELYALRDGGVVAAFVLFMFGWFSYLKLDGVKINIASKEKKEKKTKRRWQASIVDFADEHIVTFDELTDEEQTACLMAANLLSGCLFLIISIVLSLV